MNSDISTKLQALSKYIGEVVKRITDPMQPIDEKFITKIVEDAESTSRLLDGAMVDNLFKYFLVCPTKPDAPVPGEQTNNLLNVGLAPELITQNETAKKFYQNQMKQSGLLDKPIEDRIDMLISQITAHNVIIEEFLENYNSILLPKFSLKQSFMAAPKRTKPPKMAMLEELNKFYV